MDHSYVRRMMERGRPAFASDYIRLHALVRFGGLYMDTDCELLRDPSPWLAGDDLILGFHSLQNRLRKSSIATHWIAASPGNPCLRDLQCQYDTLKSAMMNNTLFTRSLLPLFPDRETSGKNSFEYVESDGIRIYHADLINPTREGHPCALEKSVVLHHAVANWGGAADPLPWWRRLYDLRLDRRILRPIEAWIRKLRSHP